MMLTDKKCAPRTIESRQTLKNRAIDRALATSRIWLEKLEPRYLMDATAATLSLDPAFADHGVLQTPTIPLSIAPTVLPVAIAPGGKFYAVPPFADGVSTLARFNENGALDPTFGTGGEVVLSAFPSYAAAIVQPDGKVIVTGSGEQMWFERINVNGTPDTTFGTGGTIFSSFPSTGYGSPLQLWLQPDGKIDAFYMSLTFSSAGHQQEHVMLMRLNADGSPDLSFGWDGSRELNFDAEVPMPSPDHPEILHLLDSLVARQLADGSVVAYVGLSNWVAGYTGNGQSAIIQIRLDANANEVSQTEVLPYDAGMGAISGPPEAIAPDGSLVLVTFHDSVAAVLRIRLDGTQDAVFGHNGIVPALSAESLTIQPDGKILFGITNGGGVYGGGLQRLNADGSPDRTFADGQPAFDDRFSYVSGSPFPLPNGDILLPVWFYHYDTTQTDSALAAILPTGGVPNTFDPFNGPVDTSMVTSVTSPSDPLNGATLTPQLHDATVTTPYQGLFATAPGWTLFNPDGTRKVFDIGSTH
jgi:uncharacterized delta-60 repeat protein